MIDPIGTAPRDNRWLATQCAIAHIVARSSTLEDATAHFLQTLCEYLGWPHGAIWRVDRTANVLRCVDTWNGVPGATDPFEDITRRITFAVGVVEFFNRTILSPDDDLLDQLATIGGQVGLLVSSAHRRRRRCLWRRIPTTPPDCSPTSTRAQKRRGGGAETERPRRSLLRLVQTLPARRRPAPARPQMDGDGGA